MCKLGLSSGPPGGRPRARLKAGTPREAPTPAPATGHRPPQQLPDAVRGPKQRGEHQPSNLCVEGRAEPPTEPRVDTEIRRPTRAAERSLGMSWSQLNAGATIPHEHATGCNSMQIPSSKQDTSWAPLGCSGETCSLSEETKSRTAAATRASCHETRMTGESLPHFLRCVSSGGALPSTAVYVTTRTSFRVFYPPDTLRALSKDKLQGV